MRTRVRTSVNPRGATDSDRHDPATTDWISATGTSAVAATGAGAASALGAASLLDVHVACHVAVARTVDVGWL
jgi:2-methylisocitrate lyase-like PEP mutase family enzyme